MQHQQALCCLHLHKRILAAPAAAVWSYRKLDKAVMMQEEAIIKRSAREHKLEKIRKMDHIMIYIQMYHIQKNVCRSLGGFSKRWKKSWRNDDTIEKGKITNTRKLITTDRYQDN